MKTVWIHRIMSVLCCVAATALQPAWIAAAQPGVSDVVRTNDGGMYRGTIIERVPGDHLILLLPSGESRRFEASQIQSAGAANEDVATPPAAPPPSTLLGAPSLAGLPQPTEVRLRITSVAPGTTLLYQTGIGAGSVGNTTAVITSFGRLCMAPCEVTLPRGNHRFVVEDAEGRQRATPRPLMVDRDGELEASIESRRRQRIVRWMVTLGFFAASAPLVAGAFKNQTCDDYDICEVNWSYLGPGIGLMAAGYGTMMSAIFAFDRGHVEFRPY